MGKGWYGKGKGSHTQCFNCGKFGHIASQCRSKGKGKGKGKFGRGFKGYKGKGKGVYAVMWNQDPNYGQENYNWYDPYANTVNAISPNGKGWSQTPPGLGKGGFNGVCYNCGEYGHSQNYCPHQTDQTQTANVQQVQGQQPGVLSMGGYLQSVNAMPKKIVTINEDAEKTSFNDDPEQIYTEDWQVKVAKSRSPRDLRPIQRVKKIQHLSRANPKPVSINSVEPSTYQGNFERVQVTVDSGAIDSVIPKAVAQAFKLEQTYASRNGIDYKGANDSPIKNYGQRNVQGLTGEWAPIQQAFQVAGVTKALGSVDKAVDASNTVVFDSEGSFVYHKPTGQYTGMYRENGEFKYDLWLPRPRSIAQVNSPVEITKGAFGVLAAESPSEDSSFQRQDPLDG